MICMFLYVRVCVHVCVHVCVCIGACVCALCESIEPLNLFATAAATPHTTYRHELDVLLWRFIFLHRR